MDGSDGKSNFQRATRDPEYYFTNVVFRVSARIPADFRGGSQSSSCRSEVASSESPGTDLRFQERPSRQCSSYPQMIRGRRDPATTTQSCSSSSELTVYMVIFKSLWIIAKSEPQMVVLSMRDAVSGLSASLPSDFF